MTEILENEIDTCTGLLNFRYLKRMTPIWLEKLESAGEQPAMVFFNIRQFHLYNRYFGFAAGDIMLQKVGRIIKDHCRCGVCCHPEEDHFILLTKRAGLEKELRSIIEEANSLYDGNSMYLQAGVYLFEDGAYECCNAVDRARIACNSIVEHADRDIAIFKPSSLAEKDRVTRIINRIDTAIEKEYIFAFYQPIFDTQSGELSAFETLSRWDDPEEGFMLPAEYIPVLEEFRLIGRHDLHILDRVCRDIVAYQKKDVFWGVPVTINLSRRDFEDEAFTGRVTDLIDSYGVDRSLFCFEITESVMGLDDAYMTRQVKAFHDAGFQIWMDDFGSGYSSLTYLARYNFSVVKADMRFLYNVDKYVHNKVILKHVCNMCRELGVECLVEGVETEAQVEFLKSISCDRMQGYYLSKPKRLSELEEEYKRGSQLLSKDYKRI